MPKHWHRVTQSLNSAIGCSMCSYAFRQDELNLGEYRRFAIALIDTGTLRNAMGRAM